MFKVGNEEMMTEKEAAYHLGISPSTLGYWRRTGRPGGLRFDIPQPFRYRGRIIAYKAVEVRAHRWYRD